MKAENELRNQRLQNLLKALRDMLLLLEGEEETSSEHQICASRALKVSRNNFTQQNKSILLSYAALRPTYAEIPKP